MALTFVAGYALAVKLLPPFGVHAKYFEGDNWSGPPVLQVVDREMSSDVLTERTTEFLYRYSVEWSGFVVVHRPGLYRFRTNSDDGSELAIDDRTVVFNGGVHGLQAAEGVIELTRGVHPIWMRYLQNGGTYALTVEWGPDGDQLVRLATRLLLADRRSYLGFWLLLIGRPLMGLLVALGFWLLLAPASRLWARGSHTQIAAFTRRTLTSLERPAVAIGLLITVGGAARIVMMLGSTGILWPDSEVYFLQSQNILAGDPLRHDPFRTLGYPFFLAAFFRFGQSPSVGSVVVATQYALGMVATLLFYLAGRRAFPPLVALCGALLFSIHSVELFYESSILSETIFVFALGLTIFEVVRLRSSASVGAYIWIGALCALLTLVRPIGQWFALCVVPALWLSIPTRRRALAAMAVVVVVNVALLLPWMAVNKREFEFFGVNVGTGMGLFRTAFEIEKMPLPESTRDPELKELVQTAFAQHWTSQRIRDELNYYHGRSGYLADKELLDFSLEAISRAPLTFAAGVLHEWMIQLGGSLHGIRTCLSPTNGPYLCSGRMSDLSHPMFPNRPTGARRRLREWLVRYFTVGYVRMWIVLAFALVGVVAYFADPKRRNPSGLLMVLTIGYMTFIPALVEWPQDRYRLPVDVLLFMFAAYGVASIGRLVSTNPQLHSTPE